MCTEKKGSVKFTIQYGCSGIDWFKVAEILRVVGMENYESAVYKTAFENSHTTVFAFDQNRLVGFGRALSDGVYQAAIYDVAVHPEYQRKGLGKMIVENIINRLPGCSIILFSSPGKEDFYRKFNFRKLMTGMARFNDPGKMMNGGFIE